MPTLRADGASVFPLVVGALAARHADGVAGVTQPAVFPHVTRAIIITL